MERLTNRDKKPISLTPQNGIRWMAIYHKLKQYEDAEENGLLVRLPCKVGTPVYAVYKKSKNEIEYDIDCFSFDIDYIDEIGKTVFLTIAEAEAKLKEMEGEKWRVN